MSIGDILDNTFEALFIPFLFFLMGSALLTMLNWGALQRFVLLYDKAFGATSEIIVSLVILIIIFEIAGIASLLCYWAKKRNIAAILAVFASISIALGLASIVPYDNSISLLRNVVIYSFISIIALGFFWSMIKFDRELWNTTS